jgi:hypothetical protein
LCGFPAWQICPFRIGNLSAAFDDIEEIKHRPPLSEDRLSGAGKARLDLTQP